MMRKHTKIIVLLKGSVIVRRVYTLRPGDTYLYSQDVVIDLLAEARIPEHIYDVTSCATNHPSHQHCKYDI